MAARGEAEAKQRPGGGPDRVDAQQSEEEARAVGTSGGAGRRRGRRWSTSRRCRRRRSPTRLARRSTALYQIGEVRINRGISRRRRRPLRNHWRWPGRWRLGNPTANGCSAGAEPVLGGVYALAAQQLDLAAHPQAGTGGRGEAWLSTRPRRLAARNRLREQQSRPRCCRRAGNLDGALAPVSCVSRGRARGLLARAPDDQELSQSVATSRDRDAPRPDARRDNSPRPLPGSSAAGP